jgi:hypothetical protein
LMTLFLLPTFYYVIERIVARRTEVPAPEVARSSA